MPFILVVLYLLLCVLCGIMGRNTAFGFLGHFLLALILTPIGDFLVQLVARPSARLRRRIDQVDP